MKTQLSSGKEDTRNLLGRNALIVLLVAPIIGVLWWLSPTGNTLPPVGRTEERLRSEAALIFRGVGVLEPVRACEYSWKHLYLTCTVPGTLSTQVQGQMLSVGWQRPNPEESSAPAKLTFHRGKDTASLICGTQGSNSTCKLSLFAPR